MVVRGGGEGVIMIIMVVVTRCGDNDNKHY